MSERFAISDLTDAASFFDLVEAENETVFITRDGEDAFAVLPINEYNKLAQPEESAAEEPESVNVEVEVAVSAPSAPAANIPSYGMPTTRTKSHAEPYTPVELPTTPIDSDDYGRSMWQDAIVERMRKVLAAEAPVEKQRLFNTVRGSFGIKRSGRDIQSHNEWLYGRNIDSTETEFNGATFVWRTDQDPAEYNVYRPTDDQANRQIIEFAYQELLAAIGDALREAAAQGASGLSRDELIEATMRLLGYKRKTTRVRDVIGAAIEQASTEGKITLQPNGTFHLS